MRPEDAWCLSPNFGKTGGRGAAVPVEGRPARGKTDQPGRAGKEGGQEEAFSGASMPKAVEAPTRRVVVRR